MARKSRKAAPLIQISEVFQWVAAIYLRLSVEDIKKKENNSIGNQRLVVEQYVSNCSDIRIHKVYQDVNYSGTNFNRPAFAEMLDDLKKGVINCIIVKDLSRFGRNYIEAGNYLEKVLPFLEVRFISVNDGYDTLTARSVDTDLVVPLKNIMHEAYARDISKKVRSQYGLKRIRGEFCGSFAPYGYTKCEHTLVVDEVAAPTVKRIFQWVSEGKSDEQIVQILNQEGVPSPSQHRFETGVLRAGKFKDCKYWYRSIVKRICDNQAYIGRLAQGRYHSATFQWDKKAAPLPEEQWVVVEDTHEAIIDSELFFRVQELRLGRKTAYQHRLEASERPISSNNDYQGLVVCGNCHATATRHKTVRTDGSVDYLFLCNVYEQVNKAACQKLYFSEKQLNKCVMETLQAQFLLLDKVKIQIDHLYNQPQNKKQLASIYGKRKQINERLGHLKQLVNELQADLENDIITPTDHVFFTREYNDDIQRLMDEISDIDNEIAGKQLEKNEWVHHTNQFVEQEFGPDMIKALISRIYLFPDNRVKIELRYKDAFEQVINLLSQEVIQ